MPRVKKEPKAAESKLDSKAVIAALPDASWVPPKEEPDAVVEPVVALHIAVPENASELETFIAVAEAKEAAEKVGPPERPCALESAPINSKATVGQSGDGTKEARLTTPAKGTEILPLTDLMWTLPVGAKIHKISESHYASVQQKEPGLRPQLTTGTAREAIAGFNAHFHPKGS